jgi:hypothetical protein
MRNGFLFFLLIVFSVPLFSQQLGVTASAVAFLPRYDNRDEAYNPDYYYHIQHKNKVWPGLRLELNFLGRERRFPIASYRGFAITYLAPKQDSASFVLKYNSGSELWVRRGLQRSSMVNISLRVGFEIPQNFSDFLMIHIGLGAGILSSRTVYQLPEDTQYRTYDKADFVPETFGPHWNMTAGFEAFTGAVYEFEKFSLVAQYSFLYGLYGVRGRFGLLDTTIRNQVSVGIFYPLIKS